MLRYRTFRNTDPPALAEIWRSRAGEAGFVQPASAELIEQLVLSRTYFDYDGLVLAWQDDRPVGFVHAGFGPDEGESRISTELGVTCMLIVRPECPGDEVAAGLLERSEDYLRRRGAKVLYGGAIRPLNPFYLGLYGGSELPGVLRSDPLLPRVYESHGYTEVDRTLIFHGDLRMFHPPVNRRQMQVRRRMTVHVTVDPPSRSWWEACTVGQFDLTRFELSPRGGSQSVAHATVRDMDPSGVPGVGRAIGLIDVHVEPQYRRQGLVTFLLGELFHHFGRQGVNRLEVQTMQHNTAAAALYRRLGFQLVDEGIVFRKGAV